MNSYNFDIDSKLLFLKHNICIFGNNKKTNEFKEIIKIIDNNTFKKVIKIDTIKELDNILETEDISILFLDIETIKYISEIRTIIVNKNIKIFLVVKDITNDLFRLKPDEFIFEPCIDKETTILKLIFKNLVLMENEINLKLNNLKITEQQKNFDKIFELLSNNSLITKTDKDGKIIYSNEIFQKVSGFKKNEILGCKHSIIRHPKTPDNDIKIMWDRISNKEVWSGVVRNRAKYGEDYIVDSKIIPELDFNGDIIGYLSVQYDITELVHKNELAQLMLDEQSNAVLVGQVGKGIISASKEFLNNFSFNCSSLNVLDLFVDVNDISVENHNLLNSYETVTLHNIRLMTLLNEIKIFDIIQKRVDSSLGKYFIITFIDVTTAQKEISNARYEADIKSNFLATMSHEIRTPLNGMIPYIELLLETNGLTKEQLEYILTIQSSSEGLLRIINDVLDFSKIESGKLEIEEISFNPVREFETIIDLYIAKANEKKINLITFIEPSLPNLIGDPLRIKQIINNLLSNAIKFTPDKGEIVFVVEDISKNPNIAKLNIYIKDDGKGIAPEHQLNIFTPFSQADNSISRKFGGTGLGLSISNNLASMMGGTISVESQIAKGSKFTLTLELKIDEETEPNNIFNNEYKVGVFTLYQEEFKCQKVLLCKYLKSMGFEYKKINSSKDVSDCDVIFILSTGADTIEWIDEEFLKSRKVISIIGNTIENTNKYYSHATIQMPINGSKIYDAIVDTQKFDEQKEVVYRYIKTCKKKYNARVLVAEDNPTNKKLARILLLKFGIDITIVDNGKLAVEEFTNNLTSETKYDLILMDIHMPIMDGTEAVKLIREYEKEHSLDAINIVALTADAIKSHQQKYLANGFNDFIPKPIDRERFNATLDKYLKESSVDVDLGANNIIDNIVPMSSTSSKREINFLKKINTLCEALELDSETAKMLLDGFIDDWKNFETSLLNAIENKDYDEIRAVAHSIKGASSSLRLDDVFIVCKNLEFLAKEQGANVDIATYKEIYFEIKQKIEE